MKILITGASGFLGTAMLPHLVFDDRVEKLYLLLRSTSKLSAEDRLHDIIDKVFVPSDRKKAKLKLCIVTGDLTMNDMGLTQQDRDVLIKNCTHLLHIGASTDFGAPLIDSRNINVEGTRKLLDFATICKREGKLQKIDYVSTAFVAGTKSGQVREEDLSRNQTFANPYEQSKYEAEVLVKSYQKDLPITIFRPSIIVGDSRNGFTPHFKVLYWPLQLLSKNILPFVPCKRSARLDIVPVDFVASAMHRIMMAPQSVGQTFHLTAGAKKAIRIDHFLEDAFSKTNIKRKPLIPVWAFKLIRSTWLRKLLSEDFWRTCELAYVYNDYLFGTGVVFDNTKTIKFLKSLGGSAAPHWQTYAEPILTYCTESKWGKRLKMPEFYYRNPDFSELPIKI